MIKHFNCEKWNGKPVVLCGVVKKMKTAAAQLQQAGIAPVFICDEEYKGESFDNILIIGYADLKRHRGDNCLLGTKLFFEQYQTALQIHREEFQSILLLLKNPFEREVYRKSINNFYRIQSDLLIIQGLEFCVTQKCTLRCEKCANLMQYFKNPIHANSVEMLNAFQRLLDAVDGIVLLKIVGGEALLNQSLVGQLLDLLLEDKNNGKVFSIDVPTNGTLLFHKEALEKMQQIGYITVLSSNYKALSNRMNEMEQELSDYDILYSRFSENNVWNDFGDLRLFSRAQQETQKLFEKCGLHTVCSTLWNGTIYPCPRAAHGRELGVIPAVSEECISIMSDQFRSSLELRKALQMFYSCQKAPTACSYCNKNSDKLVERAVQLKNPEGGDI